MSQEKRSRHRIPFTIEAVLTVGNSEVTYPQTRDISMGGIFLLTEHPLPIGTKGKVTLKLESGADTLGIQAECEVVRQAPDGMGLKFTHLDPDSSILLFNVIRYQSESPYA